MSKYPRLDGCQRKVHMSKAELPETQVLTGLAVPVTHGFTKVTEVGWLPLLIESALLQRIQWEGYPPLDKCIVNCIQLLWRACDEQDKRDKRASKCIVSLTH